MGELRVILLVAGAMLIAGIWWWNRRAKPGDLDQRHDSRDSRERRDLREPSLAPRAEPKPGAAPDSTTPNMVRPQTPLRGWAPTTAPHTRRDAEPRDDLEPDTVKQSSGFDPARQMVLSILVLPVHGERFLGADVLAVLEETELRFGARRIFHRHDPAGATLWSIANMLEPGELDPAVVQTDYVHGLVLFAVLPGPRLGSDTFADMLATARRLAARLRGELADADRSSLTPQTIQHLRESVLEFERRRAGAGS